MLRGAIVWIILILIFASPALATDRHFVFGLNPSLAYDVLQEGSITARAVQVGEAGGIRFTTETQAPIDIFPTRPDPSAVQDLSTGAIGTRTVTLRWTAPADGIGAPLSSYEGRFTAGILDESSWHVAQPILAMPIPSQPGSIDSVVVSGLGPALTYAFAVRGRDSRGVLSPIGDVLSVTTAGLPDTTAPSPIGDFEARATGPTTIILRWTAVGDDGLVGRASNYEIRQSNGTIGADTWAIATPVNVPFAPSEAGTAESLIVAGLAPATVHHFAIRARDASGNESPLSPDVFAETSPAIDTTPPMAPRGFLVEAGDDRVALSWNESPDPDLEGYIVYRRTTPDGETYPELTRTGETEFPDTSLAANLEYRYSVAAYDTSGNVSTRSDEIAITLPLEGFLPVIGGFAQEISSSPASTGSPDSMMVRIEWSAILGDRFNAFVVDRSTDDGTTWDRRATLQEPPFARARPAGPSHFSFEEGVSPGNYIYRVSAIGLRSYELAFPLVHIACGAAFSAAMERPFPNPCAGSFRIRLSPAGNPPPKVRLYDLAGRICGSLEAQSLASNPIWVWDSTSPAARELPSGLYFVRIEDGGRTAVRKIIVRK
jgi:chitodextrinase